MSTTRHFIGPSGIVPKKFAVVMLKIFCDSTDRLEDYVKAMLNKCVKDNCHSAWDDSARAYWLYLRKYEDYRNASYDCDTYDWKRPKAEQEWCPTVPQLKADADSLYTEFLKFRELAAVVCGSKAN